MFSGRSFALIAIGLLLGFGAGTALPYAGVFLAGSPAVPEDLIRAHNEADKAIAAAEVDLKQPMLPPLAKELLAARIEVLRTSSALLQQRIVAIRTWTKQEPTQPAAQPEPERLAAVEREIEIASARVQQQVKESEKWAGGLLKALADTGIAASQLKLAMLEIERIKAKYGIAWVPRMPSSPQAKPAEAARADGGIAPLSRTALIARVSNKRLVPKDLDQKIFEDVLRLDVDWDTTGLPRPTRAIKGAMVFADLFGEEMFRLLLTIDIPLIPGQRFDRKSVSFAYNQFMEQHHWVKSTELTNMSVVFVAEEVIYQNGEREKL